VAINHSTLPCQRCPEFQSRDVNPPLRGAVLRHHACPDTFALVKPTNKTHKNAPEGINVTGTGTEPNVWTESGSVAVSASHQAALVGHRARERAEGGNQELKLQEPTHTALKRPERSVFDSTKASKILQKWGMSSCSSHSQCGHLWQTV